MSSIRRITVGVVVAAIAVLTTAAPASAHDALVHSTPEVDERLQAAPENVSLTFSGELLTLGDSSQGAVVIVVDQDGRDWSAGDVAVTGNTVTVDVDPAMPEAGYQVRWQVVSEDGHPISGVIPFTIGDAEPMATQGTGDAGAPADVQEPEDQTASGSGGVPRALLIGAGGAAIAVAAFALYRFLRRARTAPAASDDVDAAEEQL
ncbi:MAG: copper resistance protein CopC [Candidatus Microbacterium colombiense]|nr:MAG: copper resistance protein CopC [Microbacterium sp.]